MLLAVQIDGLLPYEAQLRLLGLGALLSMLSPTCPPIS